MTGFVSIIKPEGVSSAWCVGAVKKKFGEKAGHMGTLDPMASGVLPVGIGKASRLFPYLLDKEKTYTAEFTFGFETDTLDITGEETERSSVIPSADEIKSALKFFTGEIMQIPPNYSAKCVGGKRGYELARRGVEFSLEPKKVSVLSFKLLDDLGGGTFRFEIKCKGGTYIRSLARDLGRKLGTYATMSKLRRDACGMFNLENGVPLEEFKKEDSVQKFIIPADEVVSFPKLVLSSEQAKKMLDGVYVDYGFESGIYRVYNESEFWGVGEADGGILKMRSYVR